MEIRLQVFLTQRHGIYEDFLVSYLQNYFHQPLSQAYHIIFLLGVLLLVHATPSGTESISFTGAVSSVFCDRFFDFRVAFFASFQRSVWGADMFTHLLVWSSCFVEPHYTVDVAMAAGLLASAAVL
jgi:hypothetical protein